MSLGDAKNWLKRQEGDPQRGWITPDRLWAMLDQIYADMELIPKHRSHTAYPAGSSVWWGSPPRIWTAPRQGIPRESPRPGEVGSLWLGMEQVLQKHVQDLPAIVPNVWVSVTHGLGSPDVVVSVRRTDTGVVLPNQPIVQVVTENSLNLAFEADTYQSGELRVVVVG